MHLTSQITLVLVTLFTLSVSLLFNLDYETFIPFELSYGVFLYLVSVAFVYAAREIFLQHTKKSKTVKFTYTILPAILSSAVAYFVLFNFEMYKPFRGGDMGGLAVGIFQLIKYSLLVLGWFVITIWLIGSAREKYHKQNDKPSRPSLLQLDLKIVLIPTILVLISLITYIANLAYSDYVSAGTKNVVTSSSNASVMFKKVKQQQDIKYCDQIINSSDIHYIKRSCYRYFFQGEVSNRKETLQGYFSLLKKYKEQVCQNTKKPLVCEEALISETKKILKNSTKHEITFAPTSYESTPEFILINVSEYKYKQEIHDYLKEDLEKFINNPIASIKTSLPDKKNKRETDIYIDIKKLNNKVTDVLAIEKIIEERQKFLVEEEKKRKELKKEKSRLKREKEKLRINKIYKKVEAEMRVKLNISPETVISKCRSQYHHNDPCLISMCANDKFAYNMKSYGFYSTSTYDVIASSTRSIHRCE